LQNSVDFTEKIVFNEVDLGENEMKEVDMGDDRKVLVIKQKGKITAIGGKCSHYGAPLIGGGLGEGRIRCPWHGACFNIETGDIEDFPGLDSLPCYDVKVEEGLVKVRAKTNDLLYDKRLKKMSKKNPGNSETFVVIGGGPAAQTCVENLRQNGFDGRIVMICKEPCLPYDRVKVSKYFNLTHDEIALRSQIFYDDNEIEVFLNVEATSLDTSNKEISLSSGNKLKYDKLFIATGARAKHPELPGNDLKNIFTLRNLVDAHKINEQLKPSSHVVILGSSFIAMEAAAYCADKAAKVTVVSRSSMLFNNLFGEAVGDRIVELFKSKNVEFIVNRGIKSFYGKNENLESVELTNGKTMQADICIVGIGSKLNTEFLLDSGLSVNADGSIDSNLYLGTNVSDVFVGGDIANAPVFTNNNELATIGHYSLAQYHGKIAALNMIGIKTELRAVPYFFTFLFGNCFTFTGHGKATEVLVEGDLESLKFTAFYFDEDENVVSMSSCQPDKSIAEFAEKLSQGYLFHKDDIEFVTE
jgi:apoptosis-inducing factor 3